MQHRFQNRSQDRAQTVIIFAGLMFVFALFGVMVIDSGLILTDRRDAQNDADRAALAGALELTLETGDAAADSAAAYAEGLSWAAKNGVDASEVLVEVISSCYSANDGIPTGVRVTVTRDPATFLVGMLPIANWQTTATATACAGRPVELIGFLPFALSESGACFEDGPNGTRQPRLGEFCNIVIDTNTQGLLGELGITPNSVCADGNSSAKVLEENIINGTNTFCRVGDSVQGNPGHNVGKTRSGLEARIASQGACNLSYSGGLAAFLAGQTAINDKFVDLWAPLGPNDADGRDDFHEIWEHPADYNPLTDNPADNLVPYDCDASAAGLQTSRRNATLIVVADFANPDGNAGPKSYIVRNFARVYLEGCTDKNDVPSRDCDFNGGGKFTIHARFVDQFGLTNADLGLDATFGDIEVFLKE